MATVVSFPPPQLLLLRRRFAHTSAQIRSPYSPLLLRCSSSLQTPSPSGVSVDDSSVSSPTEAEDNDGEFSGEITEQLQTSFSGCKTCGRDEIEKGCNGEGRIQGGIATVPGFGWWPIKAYRPCPGFVASGGRYRRRGQSMDEVAFGRGEREASVGSSDEGGSSKRRSGPRRLKG